MKTNKQDTKNQTQPISLASLTQLTEEDMAQVQGGRRPGSEGPR